MSVTMCELIWLNQLLSELKFCKIGSMKLVCESQIALHIASNPVFYEQTKHIEIDCHFMREKIIFGEVTTSFVNPSGQLADIFTMSLLEGRGYPTFVPSWMHMIYKLQLEGECCNMI